MFAIGFRGEHIVGLAQPMSLRLSSSVKCKTSAGIAEPMAIETQVLKGVPYCFAAEPQRLSIFSVKPVCVAAISRTNFRWSFWWQ